MPTLSEKFANINIEDKPSLSEKFSTKKQTLSEKFGAPAIEQDLKPIFQAKDPEEEAIFQALSQFGSSAGFGLPEFVANKLGFKIPEPETPEGRIGAGVGSLAGFILGGPVRVGSKVASKLIKPAGKFIIPKILGKQAISLGVASGLMTPQEGLFAPKQRIQQFGSGLLTGGVFGTLSFIPSTPLRMATMSGIIGLPSTLREDPLEEQIFNYGLGAWFGRKGLSAKSIINQQKQIEQLVKKGIEGERLTNTFKTNQDILNEIGKQNKTKGPLYGSAEEMLNATVKRTKVNDYRMDEKGNFVKAFRYIWRPQLETDLFTQIKKIRSLPETALRFDDVSFVLNKVPTIKSMSKFNDKQLQAFLQILSNPASKAPQITTLQPEKGNPLNLWDRIFRPNYAVMKKQGFGDFTQSGLTNTLFNNDAQRALDNTRDRVLFNNWKRIVGNRKDVSEGMALWLDGKVGDTFLTKNFGSKTLGVAKQWRQWTDLKLEGINRHRSRYGLEPIKPRKNYYTHIFDTMAEELQNPSKYHLPFDLQDALEYITPKEKFFQFGLKRKGRQGYIMDAWRAMDIYSLRANWSANDSFIRDAHRYIRFTKRSIKDPRLPEETKFGLFERSKNLEQFVKEFSGRQGSLDKALRNTMDNFNRILVNNGLPNNSVKTISEMSNLLTSAIYSTQMAFRPKLAIRNLGQHSLVIGQTGFKPLFKALSVRRTPEVLDILSKSKIIKSRSMAFAPEINKTGKFVKSGMWMFQKADLKNVTDAYLSGYFQAKGQGKSNAQAVNRGDQVAGLTQYVYLQGNRSGLARGLGLSGSVGRPLSIFTTWPTNYVEFLIASSAPEHRVNLIKYLATGTGFIMLSALAGIRGKEYVGFSSPRALFRMFKEGKLPISGITGRLELGKPTTFLPQIFNDIRKGMEGDIRDALSYTFDQDDEVNPLELLL